MIWGEMQKSKGSIVYTREVRYLDFFLLKNSLYSHIYEA